MTAWRCRYGLSNACNMMSAAADSRLLIACQTQATGALRPWASDPPTTTIVSASEDRIRYFRFVLIITLCT